ncbi:hypothetical protein D3C71_1971550 [compost metagenome]
MKLARIAASQLILEVIEKLKFRAASNADLCKCDNIVEGDMHPGFSLDKASVLGQ